MTYHGSQNAISKLPDYFENPYVPSALCFSLLTKLIGTRPVSMMVLQWWELAEPPLRHVNLLILTWTQILSNVSEMPLFSSSSRWHCPWFLEVLCWICSHWCTQLSLWDFLVSVEKRTLPISWSRGQIRTHFPLWESSQGFHFVNPIFSDC